MKNKFCQSCGMPLKKDTKQGGTNSDGSKSNQYCSYCYVNGEFTNSFSCAKEMQEFCIDQMVGLKMPRFIAWILTRGIPRLKRWKNKPIS